MFCPSSANGEITHGTIRRAVSHSKLPSLVGVRRPDCDKIWHKNVLGSPARIYFVFTFAATILIAPIAHGRDCQDKLRLHPVSVSSWRSSRKTSRHRQRSK